MILQQFLTFFIYHPIGYIPKVQLLLQYISSKSMSIIPTVQTTIDIIQLNPRAKHCHYIHPHQFPLLAPER